MRVSDGEATPVTVIALCYNHARFVGECLESIRNQTFQDFQLIVTDDCSRDDSPEQIEAWLKAHRPDAIFIRHEKNAGLCKTLNEAIARATGDYISMIATDDVWEPYKIEVQLAAMQSQLERVAVLYSDATQIDEAGTRLAKDFIEHHRPQFVPPSGNVFAALARGNFIPAMATLIRRKAILDAGGYDEQLLFEDYDMWLRLAQRHEFVFHPAKVARYRIVSTSIVRAQFTETSPAFMYTMFRVCEKKLATNLLDEAERKRHAEALWGYAYWMYVLGDARASACLWKSTLRTRRPRVFLLACLSSLGITRTQVKKIGAVVGRHD